MPKEITVDGEVAFLFGYFMGDGWTVLGKGGSRKVGFAGNDGEKLKALQRVAAVLNRWEVPHGGITHDASEHGMSLRAYSAEFASWFRALFGRYSRDRRVPSMVFAWPKPLVSAFLDGYFVADGHWNKRVRALCTWRTDLRFCVRRLVSL
jgi:intein/homing endonuclease